MLGRRGSLRYLAVGPSRWPPSRGAHERDWLLNELSPFLSRELGPWLARGLSAWSSLRPMDWLGSSLRSLRLPLDGTEHPLAFDALVRSGASTAAA